MKNIIELKRGSFDQEIDLTKNELNKIKNNHLKYQILRFVLIFIHVITIGIVWFIIGAFAMLDFNILYWTEPIRWLTTVGFLLTTILWLGNAGDFTHGHSVENQISIENVKLKKYINEHMR